MSSENQLVTIESLSRLSESLLWTIESRYYVRSGIEAWAGSVPFFVTSNTVIGDSYATVIINYFRDLIRSGQGVREAPFYVIELGAGSGQFAFYCAKRLQALKEQLGLDIDICYVMTDLSERNLEFWKNQAVLKPLFESRILDIAHFDLGNPQDLKLHFRQVSLKAMDNPIALTANYLFDTTEQDAFHVENGRLYESLITLQADSDNLDDEGFPKKLKDLQYSFKYRQIKDQPYYDSPVLNKVLDYYLEHLQKGSFVLSTGMFKAIDHFKALSRNRLLLLASDKAYTHLEDIEGRGDPYLAFHGNAFSVSVNFHAVGRYFAEQGGLVFHQPQSRSLRTSAFVLGGENDTFYDFHHAIEDKLYRLGPGGYFHIYRYLRDGKFSLDACLAQMNLCDWNPYVLSKHSGKINEELPSAPDRIKRGFIEGAEKAADLIYPMPNMNNHYFSVGTIFHIGALYSRALELYQQALDFSFERQEGPNEYAMLYFHMALCYYGLDKHDLCLSALRKAKEYNPDDENIDTWLERVEDE